MVAPNEARVAHVRVLAPGRVEQVHVRAGDRVAAGQPLLVYDNVEVGELAGGYVAAAALVERAVAEAIAETGATSVKDVGRVMKAALARLAGQNVDGKAVNELVRGKLSAG